MTDRGQSKRVCLTQMYWQKECLDSVFYVANTVDFWYTPDTNECYSGPENVNHFYFPLQQYTGKHCP